MCAAVCVCTLCGVLCILCPLPILSGRDIGTDLPHLLDALTPLLPPDGRCMLRIGMTNPPFILAHLPAIAKTLNHPCVYKFLHLPVQSGSNKVLEVSKVRAVNGVLMD